MPIAFRLLITHRYAAVLLCAAVLLAFCCPGWAQEPGTTPRAKVGLVLSGGAAFGFAHLGVLKWLEQNRVPVDYVAGTSMGALIGGFYATGMPADEIERQLEKIDWDDLFRGTTPYELRTFRRKEDYRELQTTIEFGSGFTTQSGLDAAHPVGILLSRLAFPYPDDISFDDLPIPFRCVAVELQTARVVRYSEGSLARAMRASMAIPLVFTTVEENGRSYVDGSVLENLPVSVMLPGPARPANWNPDAVITVRLTQEPDTAPSPDALPTPRVDKPPPPVQADTDDRRPPSNFLDVVAKVIAAVTNENMQRSIEALNQTPGLPHVPLLVRLDSRLTPEAFAQWRGLMQAGFEEAEKNRQELLRYQVSPAEWDAYQAQKVARRRRSVTPVRVVITPQDPSRKLDPRLVAYLREFLGKYAGRTFTLSLNGQIDSDSAELAHDLNTLTGTGIFESIAYDQAILGGKPALAIRAKERTFGPPFYLVAAQLESSDTDNVQALLKLRINHIGRGFDAADEFRTDIQLGSQRFLRWEWYRPLPRHPLFVLPYIYHRKEEREFYFPGDIITNTSVTETALGVDLGLALGRSSQFRVGLTGGGRDYNIRDVSKLTGGSGGFGGGTLQYVYDGQDDAVVPFKGLYARVRGVRYARAPLTMGDGYGQLSALAWQAIPLSRWESIHVTFYRGTQTGGRTPVQERFPLGGPFRLSANAPGELRGERFTYGSVVFLRRLSPRSALVGGALYGGVWYEDGAVQNPGVAEERRRDISAVGFAATRFGPLAAGISLGDAGRQRIFVRFGRVF